MFNINLNELNKQTVSFIGIAKNAGKTTVMNRLLRDLYSGTNLNVAITSVGRDGERVDVVTKTGKPEIFIKKGTICATATRLLAKSDFTKEIIASTDINTPMGPVYIMRALSHGYVEIGGPSMVSQLIAVRDTFFELGADVVLVDGAAGRRSLGAAGMADSVILCSGAAFSRSMEETIAHTAFIAGFFSLPLANGSENALSVSGAILDSTVRDIIVRLNEEPAEAVVFDDPSKLMFGSVSMRRLVKSGVRVMLKEKPVLLGIAVNPTSPYGWKYDPDAFLAGMAGRTGVIVENVIL
ncbi:MAG: hypothetical protein ACOX75_03295 [Lachnospiraceae bacterium]